MTDSPSSTDLPTWEQAPLLGRLDLYEQAIVLTKFLDGGSVTHPVSIYDLVAALSDVPVSTGALPPNTLFWQRKHGALQMGIYVPARRWSVSVGSRRLQVPFPALVFTGLGTSYRVFAVKQRPTERSGVLYHAPCPNVHADGRICAGNTPFPQCGPATIRAAFRAFIESGFNGDLATNKCQTYPTNILALWQQLHGQKRFPLSELIHSSVRYASLLDGS